MGDLDSLDFSNRDLRNRSFRGRNLSGADFEGSDIRGCNFGHAQLVGANFERARTGQTRRQVFLPLVVAGAFALALAYGLSHMVFGALGQTPEQSAWMSVVMLHIFSGVAGVGSASRALFGWGGRVGRAGMHLSGVCSAALVGFFYLGNYFDQSLKAAIAGAVAGAGLAVVFGLMAKKPMGVIIPALGAIAAYGFSFLVWTAAIAHLSARQYIWGVCLGALSLAYVGFAICSLQALGHGVSQLIGTSFRGANLTNAQFDQGNLKNTDFSKAIGR
ncbi:MULTISPECIES: pentapeptide repeat-containing protein [Cyanophyceae]|uniref:pentapeptide repeat-containing protein n=1 Tax=Cyanophyceae TaxID=3028117 RepID=UPI00168531FE|nr:MULTISPECIES: pentapeptide repeat-containing protein [Cyanophyceae]MBD1919226.1 pentapeptide repeat-containing protein [Phormidium sp. FACHB-77]MBD2030980.1 pentapeptide repeat-containing protein [Phormidium sp. FACHB-322]MBD2054249.1 pentapeptide repeat-containing protein [Leptolyngbya sp. FACHB-60]